MATQHRLAAIARHFRSILSSTHSINSSQALILATIDISPLQNPNPRSSKRNTFPHLQRNRLADPLGSLSARHFSSRTTDSSTEDDEEEDVGEEEEEDDDEDYDDDEENCNGSVTKYRVSGKSEEEKVAEAAGIGYRVVGPLDPSEKPFKLWEPIFAVVQIGSHQFKVCNGDSIFTERLKFCEVNDKLVLNKVLMLGSKTQTIIGRPVLPDAAVHAVVEEHALDAKVIIFKKKRRKNYRRTKGHRQELTKLRITDIQGIDKSEAVEATSVAA